MSDSPHINHIFSAEEEDCLSLEQMIAYRDGQLLAEEKHYAERHLLNCELCGMAYEGIDSEEEEVLEAGAAAIAGAAWDRVGQREKKRRRGAWIWVSAAASVMLLVTAGLVIFSNPSEKNMHQVAQRYYKQPEAPGASELEAAKNERSPAETAEDGLAGPGDGPKTEELDANNLLEEDPGDRFKANGPGQVFAENQEQKPSPKDSREDQKMTTTTAGKDLSGAAMKPSRELNTERDNAGLASSNDPAKETKTLSNTTITDQRNFQQITSTVPPTSGTPKLRSKTDAPTRTLSDMSVVEEAEEELSDVYYIDDEMVLEDADQETKTRNRDKDQPDGKKQAGNDRPSFDNSKAESKNKGKGKSARKSSAARNEPAQNSYDFVARKEMEKTEKEIATAGRQDLPAAPSVSGNTTTASTFETGMEAYRKSRYTESASLLRQAAAATPSNLQAHFYAAASFMNIEQPQAAIYHLDRVLAIPGNSLYPDAEWYKALAYLKLNDRENALRLMQKIARENGKHAADARSALKEPWAR